MELLNSMVQQRRLKSAKIFNEMYRMFNIQAKNVIK